MEISDRGVNVHWNQPKSDKLENEGYMILNEFEILIGAVQKLCSVIRNSAAVLLELDNFTPSSLASVLEPEI